MPAIKESRHFAACRETGIFPVKVAFSAYVVAANEIAGDFDAAVRVEW